MINRFHSLLAVLFLMFVFTIQAQDILVFRNGDIINGIVLEITQNEVRYKKESNPKGPNYTVSKSEILSIKYKNGEIDKFDSGSILHEDATSPVVSAIPDENNEYLKSQYSSGTYETSKKVSNNKAKSASFFLKFSKTSVISSQYISLQFEPGYSVDGKWYPITGNVPGWIVKRIANLQYRIHISNKSDKVVYLDLARTSKLDEINGFLTYYDGSQVVKSTGNLSGAGVSLGPLSIGGGTSESTAVSESGNRFITLSPHATYILPSKQKFLPSYRDPYIYYETFSNYEDVVPFANKFLELRERESVYYEENESPIKIHYKLTYSLDRDFSDSEEMDFTLYAFQIIGLPMLWDKVWGSFRDTFKNFKGLDNTFIGGSVMFEK